MYWYKARESQRVFIAVSEECIVLHHCNVY